jgi:NAD(P)-dependent dehydrogenase (short-subunit alcohol dehydrogenase family)
MRTHNGRAAVLVTGAGRGLGAVMAQRLAAAGYLVLAGARGSAAAGDGIVPVRLDVTDAASIDAAVDTVTHHLGGRGLFAIVNNAAVLHASPLELASPASVQEQLQTNVAGPIAVIQAFLPLLRQGGGRIVNVSSINAQLPLPYWAVYSATKAALVAMSDALRMELAPAAIPVSVLTLGAFATDIRRDALAAWPSSATHEPARRTTGALVDMLDASAAEPAAAADALLTILAAADPPTHQAAGDGIEDLLALAAQSAAVRDAAIGELFAAVMR